MITGIVLLVALLLFGWFLLKALGYDGVITNIMMGWIKSAA